MKIAHPLIGVSERTLEALDPERLYDQIVQTAMDELHADRASLMLWNERAGRVYIAALAGTPLASKEVAVVMDRLHLEFDHR